MNKEKEKGEPVRISREDFLQRCYDSLETLATQREQYDIAIGRIHQLIAKSNTFDGREGFRVEYLEHPTGEVEVSIVEKKFGLLP